jgi:signal transduction histidine kinase
LKPSAWALSARSSSVNYCTLFCRALSRWRKLWLPQCGALLIVFTLGIGSLALAAPPVLDLDSASYVIYERAEFLKVKTLAMPTDAEWAEVSLPDSWRKNNRPIEGYGWYRLTFRLSAATVATPEVNAKAIYIPRITNNIEVFLNDSPIGMSGRVGDDFEESWNRAQYHLLPASLLRAGNNTLTIRLHPNNYERAGVGSVYIGDARALKEIYQRRYFLQISVPQLITGVMAVMAAYSFTIWLRRRSETLFLLFGWMAIVGIVRLAHHYMREMPSWLAFLQVPSVMWLAVLQTCLAFYYAGRPMPRVERVMFIVATVLTILLLIAGVAGHMKLGIDLIYVGMAGATPLLLGLGVYQLSRTLSVANMFMIVAIAANAAFGIHDFLNFLELLGYERLYLLPMGLPLILLAVAALLAQRFVGTISNYETLNAELSSRIKQREQELAESYERERTIAQARAMAEERQRLMRDMHDGIGSHLMSTLALSRMGTLSPAQMSDALADCIDELKITIDSLEPVERDLLVVLGNLRYRLEPRLTAAGISLDWAVQDLPPLEYLDPENVRSVLRIVQEAFTNTLKHAKAKRITLSTSVNYTTNRVMVRVTDDGVGVGIAGNNGKSGRGVENMRSRAVKLGGELEMTRLDTGGTCINLYLPITRTMGR